MSQAAQMKSHVVDTPDVNHSVRIA